MAYTIIRSNGATLTTIQDGTIDTTSTSMGLPGRNYAGYGQTLDTNFVRIIENFANDTPPPNPIKGQLWYNTTLNTLNICPSDGTTSANAWLTLASTNSGGSTTLGNLTVTGNIIANNAAIANILTSDTITVRLATVSDTLTACVASVTSGSIISLNTQSISTGSPTTPGSIEGQWQLIGNNLTGGNALSVTTGNISFTANSVNGIKCDNYMYANGIAFNPAGTFNTTSVHDYLTGSNSVSRFTGDIAPNSVTTSLLAGGGTISGIWTLAAGARFNATYADLAERFESDGAYEPGTVVELGGDKEITAVVSDLSELVFGVVSNTAAMLMNGAAGDDKTHPPIAVSGRVQVKVKGQVKKGDRLVSAGSGYARSAKAGEPTAFNTIGRSLVNKTTDDAGTVEAIVIIR
jgi:hypothetical protein